MEKRREYDGISVKKAIMLCVVSAFISAAIFLLLLVPRVGKTEFEVRKCTIEHVDYENNKVLIYDAAIQDSVTISGVSHTTLYNIKSGKTYFITASTVPLGITPIKIKQAQYYIEDAVLNGPED